MPFGILFCGFLLPGKYLLLPYNVMILNCEGFNNTKVILNNVFPSFWYDIC